MRWDDDILKGYKEVIAAQLQDLRRRQQEELVYAGQLDDRAISAGGHRSRLALELRKRQTHLMQLV